MPSNISPQHISLGQWGEQQAQDYYQRLGFRIVARNFANSRGKRLGEIDFVACRNTTIAFVEVKTRRQLVGRPSRFGLAAQSISWAKRLRLLKIVKLFLQQRQYQALRPQIDICLVEVRDLDRRDFSVTILANAVTDD